MKSNPFNRGEEKSELAKWLDECETDYIKLRRGIIDACDELSENLLHVNSSLCSSIGFREDIQDKLIELRTMLPVRDPGEKCKQLLLKRMARAIVHDWESYNPNNATFGFLLRTARNWLAHEKGKLTIKVEETDIAFLFILHIRSVFKSYSANYLRSIEMKLLLLFNSPNTQLDCQALNESVKLSYYTMHTMTEYIKTLDCYKCEYKGDSFFQLSSFCRMHLEHSHDLTKYKITEFSLGKKWLQNGMTLIYQGFFHAVCSPESNKLSHLPRDRYGVVNFTFNEPKKFMDVFINYAEFPKLEESDE